MPALLDALPGFRRRFRITPAQYRVSSEVEDDIHCMGVTVHHDGVIATRVEPVMQRAPWNTCPGAIARLRETFTGVALSAFVDSSEKRTNCTHLHDLAFLAAAHAFDSEVLIYDILVSDPVDGVRHAQLRRNGVTTLQWTEQRGIFIEPAVISGLTLMQLGPWISTLDAAGQEAARVLRWGALIAHGRLIPMAEQSNASRMPANCYTFQPQVASQAVRIGKIRDFSGGTEQPLAMRVVN